MSFEFDKKLFEINLKEFNDRNKNYKYLANLGKSISELQEVIKTLTDKKFFEKQLTDSLKLALDFEVLAQSKGLSDHDATNELAKDIQLLTKSNNVTASILRGENPDTADIMNCVNEIDRKITAAKHQFEARLTKSAETWQNAKVGLIMAAVVVALATIAVIGGLTLPFFTFAAIAGVTMLVATGGSYIAAMVSHMNGEEKPLVSDKLYNDQHRLFRQNSKTYDAHLKTIKFVVDDYSLERVSEAKNGR